MSLKNCWNASRNLAVTIVFAGLIANLSAVQTAKAETTALDAPQREAIAALPALRGDGIAAAELANQIVVVAFFASWCPPCNPEFDHLEAVRQKFTDKPVKILAVNIYESFSGPGGDERVQGFLDLKNPGFVTLGEGEKISKDFGTVNRIPSVFVFDQSGDLTFNFVHGVGAEKTHVDEEELTRVIEKLL